MYYEIFDELRIAAEAGESIDPQLLINKSYIDSFYDVRSQIRPIYDRKNDLDRLIQKNYTYFFTQKIVHGISKAIFLGVDPDAWEKDFFFPSGRMKVPKNPINFTLGEPTLLFENSDTFSYATSSLQKWEDAYLTLAPALLEEFNLKISADGFKAQLYRILEIIFSYRFDGKKRSSWVVFLHELIIHGKTFKREELPSRFTLSSKSNRLELRDPGFETLPYLEYIHNRQLGNLETTVPKDMKLTGDAMADFSAINKYLLGRIPMCHFSIGELMFIAKDEYHLNQYYDWYVKTWTQAKDIEIFYLDNDHHSRKSCDIKDFPEQLRRMKYAIVLGFKSGETYYSAEPKMLKD